MRLKEFFLTRYGPLPFKGKETRLELGDFNLIYGNNEAGKTLIIDALVKMLLGDETGGFPKIDRVDEKPTGYLVIESDGEKIKLPEKGTLPDYCGLTPHQCRNIFVVRNSDLSISEESRFYENITDRLTGLRTEEIKTLLETLRELADITRTGRFKNTEETSKLKDRIERGRKISKRIKETKARLSEKGFDTLSDRLASRKRELTDLKDKIEKLETAEKREKYEKAKEALKGLRKTDKELKDLGSFDEEGKNRWAEKKREIEKLKEDKSDKKGQLRETREEIKKKREKIREYDSEIKQLERKENALEDRKLELDIEDFRENKKKCTGMKEKKNITLLGVGLSFIALLVLVFIYPLYSAIPAFLTALFFVIWVFLKYKEINLKKEFEGIKMEASELGLGGESIEEILSNIKDFKEKLSKKRDIIKTLEADRDHLTKNRDDLEKEIEEIREKIDKDEKAVNEIKFKTGVESLKEYEKKLQKKIGLEETKNKNMTILETRFDKSEKEDKKEYWKKKVKELSEYKNKASEIDYSEEREEDLKDKKEETKNEIEELDKQLREGRKTLWDLREEVLEVVPGKDVPPCDMLDDLEELKRLLENFVEQRENTKNYAEKAIEIFEQIESEEKESISELFGKDSSVSEYFSRMTGDYYREVHYDQTAETAFIKAVRKSGEPLSVDKLSGGTYDQLYFSVRLSLADKLLSGGKGFFILDDPFIKADPVRLEEQIDIVKNISKTHQIIYFSAKGEVRELLDEEIENGSVKLHLLD